MSLRYEVTTCLAVHIFGNEGKIQKALSFWPRPQNPRNWWLLQSLLQQKPLKKQVESSKFMGEVTKRKGCCFFLSQERMPSLKLTASLHLKMDSWNTFLFHFGSYGLFSGVNSLASFQGGYAWKCRWSTARKAIRVSAHHHRPWGPPLFHGKKKTKRCGLKK